MKTPIETRAARMPTPPKGTDAPVMVDVFALSDVGRTRDHNEDAFVVADLSNGAPLQFDKVLRQPAGPVGHLFMVADGMGGAAAGELASETAVDVVLRYMKEQWSPRRSSDGPTFVQALETATDVANTSIYRHAVEHPELRGMGTTATIAGLLGDTLYLAQVGDSRAYLVRDGTARQITKDQSLMQKLLEAGEITEEEAEISERRNIILQALGPEAVIRIDLTYQRVRRGDVLVLCSDGLSGIVRGEEIGRAVAEEADLQLACRRLIGMANALGGPDNITVVAARFDGSGLAAPNDDDHVGHRIFAVPGREVGPGDSVDDLMRAKTEQMEAVFQKTPLELPAAVRTERQELSLVVRGVLAAAAVVLGGYLIWQILQYFSGR
ncbi:MAG: serine/threonine-protein phosphatase [Gemmatimonadetes bacterium]|jgi:serine/threonine protein phosphatase PrpC|nr:serine/threonine-protein phosphatase [Gemmatimonadota bacterium]MBK8057858.1 serine/threonine-protein phosphatase [Gemmatimonadota bacterium]MBK8646789.1 serine/threonine-protein phosphatase [Gemmatimonadota bacterium]MBK9411020.1 serine/threonine-protein phosphatase [Gemmatimonadota bacterium]MBK9977994.1 serine/threonine-protein phosphatase [Gemmatimonadota bacterium]